MTIQEDTASRTMRIASARIASARIASARIASGKSERGAWMKACASSDDDLRG